MEEIKRLRKQLAEMRRLGQSQTVIGSEKYRELIAQVYAELKKLGGPRLPSSKEWAEAAGVESEDGDGRQGRGCFCFTS